MTIQGSTKKYRLPIIGNVSFTDFDLYQNDPNIDVPVKKSVFCLVGANGLGKSTFLNTLSYTVTGAIPDPDRTFLSAKEYSKNARRMERTSDYFTGRINQLNRATARSEVLLLWPDTQVSVERDFFDNLGPVRITIKRDEVIETYDIDDGFSAEEIEQKYKQAVIENTGLTEFDQFVFIFHFVMMFDEGRHLILWDDAALTTALYLAFGADPEAAKQEDNLRREMDREDSRARNVRFAAKKVMDRAEQLKRIIETGDDEQSASVLELQVQYDRLRDNVNECERRIYQKQNALRDVEVRWAEASSQLTELQIEYRKAFANRLSTNSVAEHHPVIRATLTENVCGVCNTKGVAEVVEQIIKDQKCPLCGTEIDDSQHDKEAFSKLKAIDKDIAALRTVISQTVIERDRVVSEVKASNQAVEASKAQLAKFETQNEIELSNIGQSDDYKLIENQLDKLNSEYKSLLEKAQKHRNKRDAIRRDLRKFETDFKQRYSIASERFVPRFRELAEAFIGLDIDIQLNEFTGATKAGFGLDLQMSGKLRQRPDEMSESQRFFMDIALRMALIETMSEGDATLLIDTPEGSLDIAYEARAGQMFSKFVETSNRILMTANLKSSQLIYRLARLCRNDQMELIRMTDWSELTAVQHDEEKLFEDAYKSIEKALGA